ncbi:MAG: glycosyltransferase family 2 protein, partial [Longimicrobiales bacterium]
RSALNHTYPPHEVIVVDDASEGEEAAKLAGLSSDRVRILRSETRVGGGAARNLGWKAARSPLVAFLDDDDVWLPRKLERQVPLFRDQGVGFSWTAYSIIEGPSERLRAEVRPRAAVFHELLARSELSNCTLMVRRALLEEIGGYDDYLPRNQDWDLFLRLTSRFRGVYLDELLTTVRHHVPDPEACIRGREMLMRKWAPAISSLTPAQRREVEAEHHWLLWGNYGLLGDTTNEFRHLSRALARRPFRWRYLRSLALLILHGLGWRGRHAKGGGRSH